jgi:tetratricopeptide (TPR) repeat protein
VLKAQFELLHSFRDQRSEVCDSYYRGQTAKRAKGVASCEQEIALDPNNAKAWFKHGVALYTLGLYSEAITSYDKAIALDPNYSAAKQNREVALKKQSQQ